MFQFHKEPIETLDDLVKQLSTVSPTTPDENLLRNRPHHLMFDYGPRLRYPRISTAFTVEKMTMYNKRDASDGVPALVFRTKNLPRARILGQVYCVTTDEIENLDISKQNGYAFYRKRAPLLFPFLDENRELVKHSAWMYLARPEAWQKQLDWDRDFYKGYGDFQIPKVNPAPANFREFEKLRYFKYSPKIEDPFKRAKGPHLRSEGTQDMVRSMDRSIAEKDERDRRMMPKEEPPVRNFICLPGKLEIEQSVARETTVSEVYE